MPETYPAFEQLLDAYEAEHFAPDPGGRRVAEATLALLASFYPAPLARPVELASRALMDAPLLDAFGFAHPSPATVAAVRGAMRVRARLLARLPARRHARHSADLPRIKSYPGGYRIEDLGVFPRGCPVSRP